MVVNEWTAPLVMFAVFIVAVVVFVVWALVDVISEGRKVREHRRKLFRRGRIKKVSEWKS